MRPPSLRDIVTRIPATLALVAVVLIVGVAGQGLWSPTAQQPWWESVAFGVPALQDGRWWTPVTGTFFVAEPWGYLFAVLGFFWMGLLEWQRGWRRALLYFGAGQLVAVLATAAFLWLASMLPWPWAITLAGMLDVGPSGGTMACFAACVSLFASPWRQRGWIIVVGYTAIGLLFLGTLADLEHAFAVVFVLVVDRSFRIQRASVRERRLLAFAAGLALGVVQILTLLLPTNGPFGPTAAADGPWVEVLIDAAVILLVANGLRLGRRWAWVLTVIWAVVNVLVAVLYIALSVLDPVDLQLDWGDADVAIATSVLWLAFLIYLVATRRAFASHRRRPLGVPRKREHRELPTADDARAIIKADGGGTLSWMATWEGMEYFRTTAGLVPYQKHLGVAIVLADPLGPSESVAASVDEFVRAAERDSLVPCFFSSSQATRDAMPEGWRDLIIADDTIVDLPGLAFTGKAWANIRTALNKAEREGMTFRLTRLADEPWGVRQQLRAISEGWVGDKELPEMRFTLGTLQEADDPEVRLALALSPQGDVDGFLSWLPVFGPGGEHHGWTLDLMRRRDDGFGSVMEYLIGSSARAFAEEGAQILSLSGAPLAHHAGEDEGRIAHLLGQLSAILEPVYGFSSLHRFKQKFNPRSEPIYLLYRDEGDLTRIGAALTRAFLPDATLRQFAGAGLDMLRRD
ncbi:phosphatidylglycerol lysyltransferase domain-containing protein [Herbiconiux sp.]|uniref:bifunctional lysylphosphatidylglycerol flippase/synthetase MprF n=1 Tax=Herbiconiux sp. TaxID=1871186 RepID=UPI0025B84498|nr:phosphatidylglycerol lysyltransferase domain-containing protein [Herbiconiux sp.]